MFIQDKHLSFINWISSDNNEIRLDRGLLPWIHSPHSLARSLMIMQHADDQHAIQELNSFYQSS